MKSQKRLPSVGRFFYEARALGKERQIRVVIGEADAGKVAQIRAFARHSTPAIVVVEKPADQGGLQCFIPLAMAPRLLPALFAAAQLSDQTLCLGEPLYVMYPDVLVKVRAAAPQIRIEGREFLFED
jgi:hypothetical protein